jgi:NDP-sugar pyrophosphorylase family protein
MILAGGMGTRLRPLTFSIPKPLLPVGEKPVLEIIIGQLRQAGFGEIVLATGYQAELIRAFCGDGARFGVRIDYVHEDQPLGTGGPLDALRDRIAPDEYFLLMNGDVITELDFNAFMQAGCASGCDLTVAYTNYRYRSPYGVLEIDGGAVTGVTEKPEQEYAVSAGIYCVNARALAWVPRRAFFTMPELMKRLHAAGRRVQAYPIPGYWLGLETIENFEEAVRRLGQARG